MYKELIRLLLKIIGVNGKITVVMIISLVAIFTVSCSRPEERLVVGIIAPSTDWLPLYMALDLEFLDEKDVKLHYFSTGWEVNEALIAERIDIAIMPFTYGWKGVSGDKNIRIISFFERESDGIITAPDISNLQQLNRRRIGVLRASTLDIFTHLIMDKYDFKPEIVYFRTPTEMVVALQEGYVDALSFYVPVIFKVDDPFKTIHWYGDSYPDHPCCDIIATDSAINEKKEAITNFVDIMRISCEYILKKPKKAIQSIMDNWQLCSSSAERTLKHTSFRVSLDEDGKHFQLKTAEKMVELGYLKRLPDFSEVYYEGFQDK